MNIVTKLFSCIYSNFCKYMKIIFVILSFMVFLHVLKISCSLNLKCESVKLPNRNDDSEITTMSKRMVNTKWWHSQRCLVKKKLWLRVNLNVITEFWYHWIFFSIDRSFTLYTYRARRRFKTVRRRYNYVPMGRPETPPDGKYTTEPLRFIRSGGRDLNGTHHKKTHCMKSWGVFLLKGKKGVVGQATF